jgi:hypothetical protein
LTCVTSLQICALSLPVRIWTALDQRSLAIPPTMGRRVHSLCECCRPGAPCAVWLRLRSSSSICATSYLTAARSCCLSGLVCWVGHRGGTACRHHVIRIACRGARSSAKPNANRGRAGERLRRGRPLSSSRSGGRSSASDCRRRRRDHSSREGLGQRCRLLGRGCDSQANAPEGLRDAASFPNRPRRLSTSGRLPQRPRCPFGLQPAQPA